MFTSIKNARGLDGDNSHYKKPTGGMAADLYQGMPSGMRLADNVVRAVECHLYHIDKNRGRKMKNVELWVTPKAQDDLDKLENRDEIDSLMKEIISSPLMFSNHAKKLDSESLEKIRPDMPGTGYSFMYKKLYFAFYKPEQNNRLYLIAVI